jgi:hypothetical protein
MAAKPEKHLRFKHCRQTGLIEKVDTSLVVHLGLLTGNANFGMQLAARVDAPLYEWHSKRAPIGSDSISQPLGIEDVEHELYPLGRAALKYRQYGRSLVGWQRHQHKMVWTFFIEPVGNTPSPFRRWP